MWVTMWEEFRSHCDSQYQMTSEFFSQYLHILVTIFSERRNSSAEKIVPLKKHRKNVNFGPISKKFIFLKWKWKTGLNGPIKSPKFEKKFERERTSNFCILWADCEQIVSDKVEANLNEVGKLLTMWAEFRSQCGEQI